MPAGGCPGGGYGRRGLGEVSPTNTPKIKKSKKRKEGVREGREGRIESNPHPTQ